MVLLLALASPLLFVRIEQVPQGKWPLRWRGWTGFGEDGEVTITDEVKVKDGEVRPEGTVTKRTVSEKQQSGKTLWDLLSVLGVPFVLTTLVGHLP